MEGHDIIFIAGEPWEHYTWRRRHHVAWNLAKNNRVLFVEPPLSFVQPFIDIDLSWRHALNLGKFKHQGRNLYSFSPWRVLISSLPFSGKFGYEDINKKLIKKQVVKIADKLNFRNPILWVYFNPYQYEYYGLFKEKITVTDWYDKYTAFAGAAIPDETLKEVINKENVLLQKANVVFAVSEELAKDIQRRNKNVFVIPQGVDIESFKNRKPFDKSKISKLLEKKSPVLGFLGIMHNIVDFDLLDYIAQAKPEWTILLIGREWLKNEEDIKAYKRLVERKNVYYMGEINKEEIPGYLEYVDVCLMPMKKIELNKCAAPLKLWEYLAAGKPIVAVDQGIKYDCNEYIKMAQNSDEFVKKIEECLGETNKSEMSEQRKKVAKNNSWEQRVNSMFEVIENNLKGK